MSEHFLPSEYEMDKLMAFVDAHANDDVRQLALKRVGGIDLPFALDQIAGRQAARRKIPSWAEHDGIIYPPHLSMEQCSSEQTAQYKREIVRELQIERQRMVDLTGGFGVDFSFLSYGFERAVYVERQQRLCAVATHNFRALNINNVETVCADAKDYLKEMPHATLVFIDPARRDANGARTFSIADCTPNLLEMKDLLVEKADYTLIKLSPMLDWRKAVSDMGSGVGEVHIVSVGGECKELLLIMSKRFSGLWRVVCVNDDSRFSLTPNDIGVERFATPAANLFLYEPNASVMKAGCFSHLMSHFAVSQVGRNSHLFVSNQSIDAFPGRRFLIVRTTTMNKKELKASLNGITKANIAVRNFPLTVPALRQRLKLSDGGDAYIFATTLNDNSHILLICRKA